ncbi:MAG TPA: protein-L-isoaspartate(D-aspartate) O-methyltransferase [Desulfuromonadales bacterium]|nr:protein-L-isoaspartate(D-aspartate) O-methyltransferase [Desulfuromonadales bacterium]
MNFATARRRMVERHIQGRGITDPLVIEAMCQVPRHLFVEEALQGQAYSDYPLPIGEKQTISQPFTVALMTQSLQLRGGEKVLEIGTGSGYQAAVLARIASRVYTVERFPALARRARRVLDAIGAGTVNIRLSDGTSGWEDEAPFDAIIITAGAPSIPSQYREQLAVGGRLVIPVGTLGTQVLKRVVRVGEKEYAEEDLLDCRFVPLVGRFGWEEEKAG